MTNPIVYHIPVCPFCQRLEILLSLKGRRHEVDFRVVDVTLPRPEWLLQKTRGTSALPILEISGERIITVENMLTRLEGEFCTQGYRWVMNQEPERRHALEAGMLKHYERLKDFLLEHAPSGPFLFEEFGWAETVFTPLFMRFWFLEYYEDFRLPVEQRYARVRQWIDACVAHPAAQQVTKEEVVKLYYDYAKGAGNGALLHGRRQSSFTFEPDWRVRPWPPRNKYEHSATDEELGLWPVS